MKNKIYNWLILLVGLLMITTSVSAVTVNLNTTESANQGDSVVFDVNTTLTEPDQYLPVKYTDFVITGPSGFEKTCRIYNNGTIEGCDLDVSGSFNASTVLVVGHRIGLDNGTGYYFGYGPGLGNDQDIKYNLMWNTPSNLTTGTYTVVAKVFAAGENSNDTSVIGDGRYTYCGVMEGMYREWYALQGANQSYDPSLDMNNDGVIDLSDIISFATNSTINNDSVIYGMYREYFSAQNNFVINPELDINGDGIIDLTDIVLFAQNMNNEDWCAARIASVPGNSHYFNSVEKTFVINSIPDNNNGGNGGGSGGGNSYGDKGGAITLNVTKNNQTQNTNEDNNSTNLEQNVNTNDQATTQTNNSTGFLGAITGAVAGLGSAIGFGATLSYIISILVLLFLIVLGVRVFSKKKKN